jgi:hypothetical protein
MKTGKAKRMIELYIQKKLHLRLLSNVLLHTFLQILKRVLLLIVSRLSRERQNGMIELDIQKKIHLRLLNKVLLHGFLQILKRVLLLIVSQ